MLCKRFLYAILFVIVFMCLVIPLQAFASTGGIYYINIGFLDQDDNALYYFNRSPNDGDLEYEIIIPEFTHYMVVNCIPNNQDTAMQLTVNGNQSNFTEKIHIGQQNDIQALVELFQNFDYDVYTINITKSTAELPTIGGSNSSGERSGGSSYSNALITPSRVTFDKKSNEDVTVTLSSGRYSLHSLKNGSYTLVKGTDYTVNGNKYTVKAAYLATLAIGEQTVIFDMSGGSDPKLTITVEDTTQETAEPSPNPAPTSIPIEWQNPFADVKSSDWFYGAVEYVFTNDLMMGTSTDPLLFSPSATVTRGMVVTVLYRAAGSPDVTGRTNPFNDVAEDKYYTNAVIWAAANGIVSGYEDGRYGPEDNITREQLTAILNNYSESAGIILPVTREYVSFSDDADIAIYAKEAIEQFFKSGIINGKSGNLFDPKGSATRAELATMLKGLLKGII